MTDPAGTRLVAVKHHGQVPCGTVANRPVTGVAAREGELVLHPNAGLEEARRSLQLAWAFFVAFSVFAGHYLRKWRARRPGRLREGGG